MASDVKAASSAPGRLLPAGRAFKFRVQIRNDKVYESLNADTASARALTHAAPDGDRSQGKVRPQRTGVRVGWLHCSACMHSITECWPPLATSSVASPDICVGSTRKGVSSSPAFALHSWPISPKPHE